MADYEFILDRGGKYNSHAKVNKPEKPEHHEKGKGSAL